MIPKTPPRPAPPPMPIREHSSSAALPEKSLVDVVKALANEALERAQRDKRGEDRDKRIDERAERIAKGIESLVLMQQLSAAAVPAGRLPSIRTSPRTWLVLAVAIGLPLTLLAGLLFGALYHVHGS